MILQLNEQSVKTYCQKWNMQPVLAVTGH